jgi:hypothetical protein
MVPIVSLLVILAISGFVIRVAAVALEHTGLSRDASRFQARSAFTGVGFTTTEAEDVVAHPVRRRIVMWLMLVGNAGVVTAMAALLLSVIDLRGQYGGGIPLAILGVGLVGLWAMSSSRWLDRRMCGAIHWAIGRWTTLDARDYARLLHLQEDYGVSRFRVGEDDWMAGKSLAAAGLGDMGLLVLGVECPGGSYVGAPPADVEVRAGDELVVYGPAHRVAELDGRKVGAVGDRAQVEAVIERRERLGDERRRARR